VSDPETLSSFLQLVFLVQITSQSQLKLDSPQLVPLLSLVLIDSKRLNSNFSYMNSLFLVNQSFSRLILQSSSLLEAILFRVLTGDQETQQSALNTLYDLLF
jgi:hypothetical protein